MATVTINGNTTTTNNSSGSIVISNGKVIIDGIDVTPDSKVITISIQGDINQLDVDACQKIEVTGNCNEIKTKSGDVDIQGNIAGSVSTMSGDIDCGNIHGSVSTMSGDIKYRKNV